VHPDLHCSNFFLRRYEGWKFFGRLNGGRGGPGAWGKSCRLAPSPWLGWTPSPRGWGGIRLKKGPGRKFLKQTPVLLLRQLLCPSRQPPGRDLGAGGGVRELLESAGVRLPQQLDRGPGAPGGGALVLVGSRWRRDFENISKGGVRFSAWEEVSDPNLMVRGKGPVPNWDRKPKYKLKNLIHIMHIVHYGMYV